ncbi:MAG: hypothetical protein H7338_17790, partial [Candidatus Sericytochromatia bacterium]|nr:hypothetical protein [Candidatus Sericytochromatia bacterium]
MTYLCLGLGLIVVILAIQVVQTRRQVQVLLLTLRRFTESADLSNRLPSKADAQVGRLNTWLNQFLTITDNIVSVAQRAARDVSTGAYALKEAGAHSLASSERAAETLHRLADGAAVQAAEVVNGAEEAAGMAEAFRLVTADTLEVT